MPRVPEAVRGEVRLLRRQLRLAAREGRPGDALSAVAGLEGVGVAPSPEDHAAVLGALAVAGRSDAAETYLRGVVAAGGADASCFAVVMLAHGLVGEADAAEWVFFKAQRTLPVSDALRVGLLRALSLAGEPDRAWLWTGRFLEQVGRPSPRLLAVMFDGQARPEHLDRLRALVDGVPEGLRGDGVVAEAFVHGFAAAGDPDLAMAYLPAALAGIRDVGAREELLTVVAYAFARAKRPDGVARVRRIAAVIGVDADVPRLDGPSG